VTGRSSSPTKSLCPLISERSLYEWWNKKPTGKPLTEVYLGNNKTHVKMDVMVGNTVGMR